MGMNVMSAKKRGMVQGEKKVKDSAPYPKASGGVKQLPRKIPKGRGY